MLNDPGKISAVKFSILQYFISLLIRCKEKLAFDPSKISCQVLYIVVPITGGKMWGEACLWSTVYTVPDYYTIQVLSESSWSCDKREIWESSLKDLNRWDTVTGTTTSLKSSSSPLTKVHGAHTNTQINKLTYTVHEFTIRTNTHIDTVTLSNICIACIHTHKNTPVNSYTHSWCDIPRTLPT